ncbi:MAG: UrcA family protein [Phenylobacterium sp.]
MTNLTHRISTVAMMALAALPIIALPASALAATVRVSDLNLATPNGMAAFERRVDQAARNYCNDLQSLHARANCREGVRVELMEKAQPIAAAHAAQMARTLAAR